MIGLLIGIAAAAAACLCHLIVLRMLPPSRRNAVLVGLLLVALLVAASVLNWSITAEDAIIAVVLCLSLAFAYLLLLNGIIHDSPTLTVVNAILRHEPGGMPVAQIASLIVASPFLLSRLDALLASGWVKDVDGKLELSRVASASIRLGDALRSLRGDHVREGG